MPALLLLALLLSGCTGWLVEDLEKRHVSSCVWFTSPFTGVRGVTATGSATISQCLDVPCRGH